ncbi:MAG: oligosaccharide flippase family protein [Actinomycetaceae bacterium]|nr:oligosaccharide flippase family protein [Actinomycetaceae bacterium]
MFNRLVAYSKSVRKSSPFLKHVLTLMTGTALGQAVVFFIMPFITRIFGRELLGELGAYNSVAAVIVTIAASRYDMAIMLERDDANAKVVAVFALRSISVFAVLSTVTALLLKPIVRAHFSDTVATWLPFIGITTFFLAGAGTLQYWYNRKTDYKTIATNRVQQQIGQAGGQLACGLLGWIALPGLIVGQTIGQAFAFLNLSIRAKDLRTIDISNAAPMRTLVRKHWKMPLLNGPNVLLDAVRTNGINLMIGAVSVGSLGEFIIASTTVQVPVHLINSAVSQVFFQKLSLIESGDMYREVKGAIIRAFVVGIPPFALFYIIAPWLLPLYFGASFPNTGYYAQALIPWLGMLLVTSPISTMFVTTGTQHWMLIFSAFYTVVPMAWLWWTPYDLLTTVYILGALMGACLLVMTGMALVGARRFDQRVEN